MAFLQRPQNEKKFDKNGRIAFPAMEFPCFRKLVAEESGVLDKILIHTNGGIGDYICVEPAIRYAIKNFTSEIYVESRAPEFYRHLKLNGVFKLPDIPANHDEFLNYHSICGGDEIAAQYFTHMFGHVVDFHTMFMWKVQLPPDEKTPRVICNDLELEVASACINPKTDVIVHPGRTWPSRTFPATFWNAVTFEIIKAGKRPVLIGAESQNDCGTVDVNTDGCLDLRNKLSLMQSVAACQLAKVVLTNDSSPLHMAATGDAWIGFISTVKPPDLLMHWRYGEYGWRMKNFSRHWLCEFIDMTPTNANVIKFNEADPIPWLPRPNEIVEWAVEKLNG